MLSTIAAVLMSLSPVPWDALLDQDTQGKAIFGVQILGDSPYSRNPEMTFRPASTSKLFTARTALDLLGPDFRFQTALTWRRTGARNSGVISELTLHGSGDPTWGSQDFGETLFTRLDQIASTLSNLGVHEVRGSIRLLSQDPRWEAIQYPEGWTSQDHVYCSGALPQAFNLQQNCAKFVLKNAANGFWLEPGIDTPVQLSLQYGDELDLSVEELGEGYRVSGTLPKIQAPSDPVSLFLPIRRPERWVKNLLLQSLRNHGILVREDLRPQSAGKVEKITFESLALSEILKPFLKYSMNLVGESIFKTLAQHFGPKDADLVLGGQEVLHQSLIQIGIDPLKTRLLDGSGLSRASQITPTSLLTLLEHLKNRSDFQILWDALPIAGIDGTLASRMKNTAAQGVLRAKTGTLDGFYHLAGYVPRYDSKANITEWVSFVVLSQTTAEHKVAIRTAEDRVGIALTESISKPKPIPAPR